MPRTVNVLLGSTAAGTFARSEVAGGGEVFAVRDSLSCGPLRPLTDVASWKHQRRAYWASLGLSFGAQPDADLISDPRVLVGADEIVLWIGTGLGDQIALAWCPAFLRALRVDPRRLRVVQFRGGEGAREILDVAMLNPREVADHPPPSPLAGEELAELDLVWRALTSADPDAVVEYAGAAGVRFPLLQRALRSLSWRYPEGATGLNVKDMRLLRQVRASGPKAVQILGHAIVESFEAGREDGDGLDQVGDLWLFWRMLRLANSVLREPALEITGSHVRYADARVRLTRFGEQLVEGRSNFVEVNGIDDWVAGVHLQSAASKVWFRRDGQLVRR